MIPILLGNGLKTEPGAKGLHFPFEIFHKLGQLVFGVYLDDLMLVSDHMGFGPVGDGFRVLLGEESLELRLIVWQGRALRKSDSLFIHGIL